MSDNLRDRIAAVLDKHYPQTTGYQDELTDWCQCGLPRDHVADAVIEALALKREHLSGRDSLYVVAGDPSPVHRYVTEWTADE